MLYETRFTLNKTNIQNNFKFYKYEATCVPRFGMMVCAIGFSIMAARFMNENNAKEGRKFIKSYSSLV